MTQGDYIVDKSKAYSVMTSIHTKIKVLISAPYLNNLSDRGGMGKTTGAPVNWTGSHTERKIQFLQC